MTLLRGVAMVVVVAMAVGGVRGTGKVTGMEDLLTLDCEGRLHGLADGPFPVHADLSYVAKTLDIYMDAAYERAREVCPDLTFAEFETDVMYGQTLASFFKIRTAQARGAPYSGPTNQCVRELLLPNQDNLFWGVLWETAKASATYLLYPFRVAGLSLPSFFYAPFSQGPFGWSDLDEALWNLPDTCSYDTWMEDGTCTGILTVGSYMPLSVAVAASRCPDHPHRAYVSVSCHGTGCTRVGMPCDVDNDCGSTITPFVCESTPITRLDLVSAHLMDAWQVGVSSCNGMHKLFFELKDWVRRTLWGVKNVGYSGLAAFPSPSPPDTVITSVGYCTVDVDHFEFDDHDMDLVWFSWDGKLDQGSPSDALHKDRVSGEAEIFSPYGKSRAVTLPPNPNDNAGSGDTARNFVFNFNCDGLVTLGLDDTMAVSVSAPLLPMAVEYFYGTWMRELLDCRADERGVCRLDDHQLRSRFSFFGPEMAYYTTTSPRPPTAALYECKKGSSSAEIADWRVWDDGGGTEPLAHRYQVPETCSFDGWMKDGQCSFTYWGLSSLVGFDTNIHGKISECDSCGGWMSSVYLVADTDELAWIHTPKACSSDSDCVGPQGGGTRTCLNYGKERTLIHETPQVPQPFSYGNEDTNLQFGVDDLTRWQLTSEKNQRVPIAPDRDHGQFCLPPSYNIGTTVGRVDLSGVTATTLDWLNVYQLANKDFARHAVTARVETCIGMPMTTEWCLMSYSYWYSKFILPVTTTAFAFGFTGDVELRMDGQALLDGYAEPTHNYTHVFAAVAIYDITGGDGEDYNDVRPNLLWRSEREVLYNSRLMSIRDIPTSECTNYGMNCVVASASNAIGTFSVKKNHVYVAVLPLADMSFVLASSPSATTPSCTAALPGMPRVGPLAPWAATVRENRAGEDGRRSIFLASTNGADSDDNDGSSSLKFCNVNIPDILERFPAWAEGQAPTYSGSVFSLSTVTDLQPNSLSIPQEGAHKCIYPNGSGSRSGLSAGVIAGITVAAIAAVGLLGAGVFHFAKGRMGSGASVEMRS